MAEKSTILYTLRQASSIIAGRVRYHSAEQYLEASSDKQRSYIVSTISSFKRIPYIAAICEELFLDSVDKIIDRFPLPSIQDCIDLYEREGNEGKKPVQEAASVPPELEALVAQYRENLAEKNENTGSVETVAESVRRAREAMLIRERLNAIRENRIAILKSQDKDGTFDETAYRKDEDNKYKNALITQSKRPKLETAEDLLEPLNSVVEQSVDSYLQDYLTNNQDLSKEDQQKLLDSKEEIVKTASYLALTESVDIANPKDLITAISIAAYSIDPQYTSPISDIYAELNENESEHNRLNQEIAKEQLKLSTLKTELSQAEEDKAEITRGQISTIEANISQKVNQRDTIQINLTPFKSQVESFVTATSGTVISGIKSLDFDSKTDQARKVLNEIQEELLKSKITPRTPPPSDPLRQATDLERNIRIELPQIGLNPNATFEARQAAGIISDPRSQSKDLSSQTILLYSKGLTTEEFDRVIAHAKAHKSDPNSELGLLYAQNSEVFGTIRQQLATIERTNTPQAHEERVRSFTSDPLNSSSGLALLSRNAAAYKEYLDLTKVKSGREIIDYARTHETSALGQFYKNNSRVFGKINSEFNSIKKSALANEISKPIGRISRTLNTINNRVISRLDKISGFFARNESILLFLFDPIGSIRSFLGRQASQYLLKYFVPKIGNLVLRRSAETLLNQGFKKSISLLSKEIVKKLGTKVAVQAGIHSLSAALAAPSGGLSLLLDAAVTALLFLGEKTLGVVKKGLNWISETLHGEEFSVKKAIRDMSLGVIGFFTGTVGAFAGFITTASAMSATAATSAIGIVVAATFIGYFFYVTSIIVAPMISTIAQLEATQSTKASGDCIFPVHGNYKICQGSKTHNPPFSTHDIIEAADFCGTSSTEIHAIANGTVSFAGNLGNVYGNYVIISTTTSAGIFDAWYAHFTEIGVSIGEEVEQDDVIGYSGGTGYGESDFWSDHLHLEYRGLEYNQCPAGGAVLPDGCYGFIECGSQYTD